MSANGRTIVVGGGIAGLAAATRLARRSGADKVVLVERDARLGGKITTERAGGFVIEGGPDCFLAAKPAGMALCKDVGLAGRVVEANPATRKTYVVRGGLLHELPEGLTGLVPSRIGPLMSTRLLSVPGRLRAALELLVPPRRGSDDESLAGFVTRRFGGETWRWLVEPLLSGIYAGDGERLSLLATFPQLKDLEKKHGSIVKSMLKARGSKGFKGSKGSRGSKGESPNGIPTGFVTLPNGMGEIADALARSLPASSVRLGRSAQRLERRGGMWVVTLDDGSVLTADAVILAVPASVAAPLLAPLDAELSRELAGIPFVSVATVSVAFPRVDVVNHGHRLPGWGYVRPRAETGGNDVVACTVTSQKFPARSPEGALLFRFFLGRSGREDLALADDAAIQSVIKEELRTMMGITAEPSLWRIRRWPAAMPQYLLGHAGRVARIEKRLASLPGLQVAGASYKGVGVPDCIASGWEAADRIQEFKSLSVQGRTTTEALPETLERLNAEAPAQ